MKTLKRILLPVLALALVLAGCGKNNGAVAEPPSEPENVTAAQETEPFTDPLTTVQAPEEFTENTSEWEIPTEASAAGFEPLTYMGTGNWLVTGITLPKGRFVLKCDIDYGYPYCEYDLCLKDGATPLVSLSGAAYAAYNDELRYFIERGDVDLADLRNTCGQTFDGGVTDASLVFHGPAEDMDWTVTITAISLEDPGTQESVPPAREPFTPLTFSGHDGQPVTGIDLPKGTYVMKCDFSSEEYEWYHVVLSVKESDERDLSLVWLAGDFTNAYSTQYTFSGGVTNAELYVGMTGFDWTVTIEQVS